MRVLLISAANDAGSMVPLPLGLACVAAAAERAGHNVRLVELGADADYDTRIREAIREVAPEVIGVSVRNIDNQNMQSPRFLLQISQKVIAASRACCSAPIVIGGAGYSIFPEAALTYLGADIGVRGEGESIFPMLLSWLESGRRFSPPPSTYFPDGSHTLNDFISDLDRFALPEAHLWLDCATSTEMRIPVQSRRGCPLRCSYCSTSAIEGFPVRRRSPEAVVNWLRRLRRSGFRRFWFVDNTFNLPPSYAKALCRTLIEADLRLDWWAIVYPKLVDNELAALMAKAGCTEVSLGFESGSDVTLAQFNKRFTCSEVRSISDILAGVGIKRNGFLLLGGPSETRQTVEESLAFAASLHLDSLKITVGIRIYPETRLASAALAEGMLTPNDNLLQPRFYLSPSVQDWLPDRIAAITEGIESGTGRATGETSCRN